MAEVVQMRLKEADRYAVIQQVIERTMGQSEAPGRLNRVRSAVTPGVNQFVAAKISAHAAWPALVSDQLRFLE